MDFILAIFVAQASRIEKFYQHFLVNAANIEKKDDIFAEHGFVSLLCIM